MVDRDSRNAETTACATELRRLNVRRYRIEAAKGMAGCCLVAALLTRCVADAIGATLSGDQFAVIILLAATAAAAWLADPPGGGRHGN